METYSAEITGINNENQSILTDTGNTVYANNWNELKTYCEKSDKNYIIHLKENTNFYPDNGTDYSQQIIVKNNVTIYKTIYFTYYIKFLKNFLIYSFKY